MIEFLSGLAPWLPCTLGPVLLLLLAPLTGARGRVVFAVLLCVLAGAGLAMAAVRFDETTDLDVINPFMNPDKGEPVVFVVEHVSAPAWLWPLVGAAFLVVAALPLLMLRRRPPAAPCPVTYGSVVTVWTFAARLALEKSAAPEALTWAIGVSIPMLILLPFVGWWSGWRRFSFAKFALVLLLLALVQRALIVGVGYLATTEGLGTHLDVGAIREVTLPLGHKDFTGPGDQKVAQWFALILIPQFVLWVPLTLVLGVLLGGPLYALAKSGQPSRQPSGQALGGDTSRS